MSSELQNFFFFFSFKLLFNYVAHSNVSSGQRSGRGCRLKWIWTVELWRNDEKMYSTALEVPDFRFSLFFLFFRSHAFFLFFSFVQLSKRILRFVASRVTNSSEIRCFLRVNGIIYRSRFCDDWLLGYISNLLSLCDSSMLRVYLAQYSTRKEKRIKMLRRIYLKPVHVYNTE